MEAPNKGPVLSQQALEVSIDLQERSSKPTPKVTTMVHPQNSQDSKVQALHSKDLHRATRVKESLMAQLASKTSFEFEMSCSVVLTKKGG